MLKIPLDLEPHEVDLCVDVLPEIYNANTVGPRLKEVDLEEAYFESIATGKGFKVTQKPFKKKIKDKDGSVKNKGIKNIHGIHSPLFGTDWQDEHAYANRYSCEYGCKIGKVFEGQRCEICGTKVRFVDVDLKMFAWLKIDAPFKLIHPQLYRKLDVFFGKNVLNNIINFKMEMSLDGHYYMKEVDPKQPFFGIGMVEFEKRFDEILEFYANKNKHSVKKDMYYDIASKKNIIFTNTVPVYSAVLRQVFFSEEDYSYTKIDKCYNSMFGNFHRLNEEKQGITELNRAKVNKNLYRAQVNLCKAYELIFDSVTSKDGLIRRQLLGGRINFSGRTVIVPNAKLKAYEVEIPYVSFVEMFSEQIVNIIKKMEGCTYGEALQQWFNGYIQYDDKIYKIINHMLKKSKHKCRILLNRNP